MAVSNLTYVWIQDADPAVPEKDGTPVPFSNYNEAMSFAKWASQNDIGNNVYCYVWNYNGGSGLWHNAAWQELANSNWP